MPEPSRADQKRARALCKAEGIKYTEALRRVLSSSVKAFASSSQTPESELAACGCDCPHGVVALVSDTGDRMNGRLCQLGDLAELVSAGWRPADGSLLLGFTPDLARVVTFNPFVDGHLLIAGVAGSGKTVSLNALNSSATASEGRAPTPSVVNVGYPSYDVSRIDPLANYRFNRESAWADLTEAYLEFRRRQGLLIEMSVATVWDLPDEVRPQPMLVLVDNVTLLLNTFSDEDNTSDSSRPRRAAAQLLAMLRQGRACGLTLVVSTQAVNANSLGDLNSAKTNFGSRLLLGRSHQQSRNATLRAPDAAPDLDQAFENSRLLVGCGILEKPVGAPIAVKVLAAAKSSASTHTYSSDNKPSGDEYGPYPSDWCCRGECCGPGSWCCEHAGRHSHPEDGMPSPVLAAAAPVQVGDRIKFGDSERRWWTVRERDERYIVATRQRPFAPKGEEQYTVVDLTGWTGRYNGVRPGPVRSSLTTLGGGWGQSMHWLASEDIAEDAPWWTGILEVLTSGRFSISPRRVVAVDELIVKR